MISSKSFKSVHVLLVAVYDVAVLGLIIAKAWTLDTLMLKWHVSVS